MAVQLAVQLLMAYYVTTSGTDTTWSVWTNSASTATTTSSSEIWTTWNTTATTTTSNTITVTDCWITWVDEWGTQHRQQVGVNSTVVLNTYAPAAETAEQREARRRREEEAAAARAERDRERRESDARAEALLVSLLDDEQRAELETAAQFHVVGSHSGKRYCIKRGSAGNVILVEEDGRRRKFCAHGRDHLPTADHMVMQKLCIEAAEDAFLAVANVS